MVFADLAHRLQDAPPPGAAPLPKYLRLSDAIARAIRAGDLAPGQQLPPESQLAAQLPASLGTVQRALNHLAERGLLVRRHGHGTFVRDRAAAMRDLWHFRFLAGDGKSLLPVFAQVLTITATDRPGPWRDFLGAKRLIEVTRRINVDGAVTGMSFLYLPEAPFEGLLATPPESLENTNIRAFLADTFGHTTERVREQVSCGALPSSVARGLNLPPRQVGLAYHMQGFGFRDRPLSYQVAYFPPGDGRLALGEKHE